MTIMITNDDGLDYNGLYALKCELEGLDDVIVIAPVKEKSGVGKALSVKVKVEKLNLKDGSLAYGVYGTPADAVLIGLTSILKDKPKLLASGINGGPNLGVEDFFNSGTIGAALEAALHGIPAFSISLAMRDVNYKDKLEVEDFKYAAKVARVVAEWILEYGLPKDVLLINVNVPEEPNGKVLLTRLANYSYKNIHVLVANNTYEITKWKLDMYEDDTPGTDVWAIRRGYISITPISIKGLDMIAHEELNDLVKMLSSMVKV